MMEVEVYFVYDKKKTLPGENLEKAGIN